MKLIENTLPLREINVNCRIEMSGKFVSKNEKSALSNVLKISTSNKIKYIIPPRLHNLHYYPARIPASGARAVTLAAALPDNVSIDDYLKALGFEALREYVKSKGGLAPLYMVDPDRELVKKLMGKDPREFIVVDPMAGGGGSIPLEALRLGFTTIAGDANPVSYLLLRATIEFPAKYGRKLYELVRDEVKKLLEFARNELSKYFPSDGRGMIFVLSAKHSCGGIVPIVKTTVLSKEDGGVYFTFIKNGNTIRAKLMKEPPGPMVKCPHCGMPINPDALRNDWVKRHKEVIDRLLSGDESAADFVEELYIPVAVQVKGGYREPSDEDVKMLKDAARELARLARNNGDTFEVLPTAEVPSDNEVFSDVKKSGLTHWHYLFNPRQLLVLYKLIKYVRDRADKLIREYGELGAAAALYLALGLSKMISYNNILVQWHSSRETSRDLVGSQYALKRSVELGYDFVELNPIYPNASLEWAFELNVAESGRYYLTAGGLMPVLRFLSEHLEGLWKEGRDAVYLWDAARLSQYLPLSSVDLIHVDPPYYDQHDYMGITEFFWQILQRALWPTLDYLFPRDRVKIDWSPLSPELPKKLEIKGPPPREVGGYSRFGDAIKEFLIESSKVLKDDGLLLMWYTYGKLEGWEELFMRFYEANYRIVSNWQVWSQAPQRRVALETRAFFTSLVIVARPGREGRALIPDYRDPRLIEEVERMVRNSVGSMVKLYGLDLLREVAVMSIANGLAMVTKFEVMGSKDPLGVRASFRNMVNTALNTSVNAFLESIAQHREVKHVPLSAMDPPISRLYLFLFILSDYEDGEYLVPYDIANRLAQVIGASLKAITVEPKSKSRRESVMLKGPGDVIRTMSRGLVVEAFRVIYEVNDLVNKGSIRSAEGIVKNFSRDALGYAYYVLALASNKLGITNGEVVMKIIGGGAL